MQGKTNKQKEDAMRGFVIGIFGIIVVLIFLSFKNEFTKMKQQKINELNKSGVYTTHLDSIFKKDSLRLDSLSLKFDKLNKTLDSLDLIFPDTVDTLEVDNWNQGDCPGDEYKMWIGENGDTIWE